MGGKHLNHDRRIEKWAFDISEGFISTLWLILTRLHFDEWHYLRRDDNGECFFGGYNKSGNAKKIYIFNTYSYLGHMELTFHCIVCCSSSIYGFWLPLWYLQTILLPDDDHNCFFFYISNYLGSDKYFTFILYGAIIYFLLTLIPQTIKWHRHNPLKCKSWNRYTNTAVKPVNGIRACNSIQILLVSGKTCRSNLCPHS
jgi:hypothetical protein